MQILDEPRFDAPAVALVVDRVELAADGEAFAQRRGERQLGLLLDRNYGKPVAHLQLAVVQLPLAGDDVQQR
jgi:hypothetical protein